MPPDLVKWGTLIASASAVDQARKASAAAEATRTEVRATRAELADLKRGLAVEAEAKEALRRLKQLVYEKRKQLDKAATLVQTNPMGAFMLTATAVSALQGLDASMFEDFADKEYYDSAIEKAGDLSRQLEAALGQEKLGNLIRIMKLAEQCSSADYAIAQLYPIVQNAKGSEKEKAVSKLVKVAASRDQSYGQLSALVEKMPELNATNSPFLRNIEGWKKHKKEQVEKALLEFRCMILLCKADGKIAPEEKEQIMSFGKKIGLADSQISETFSATKSLSFKGIMHTHEELVGLFARLADVAQADGVVAPEERQILATLAKAFDLSKNEIKSALSAEARAKRYRKIASKYLRGEALCKGKRIPRDMLAKLVKMPNFDKRKDIPVLLFYSFSCKILVTDSYLSWVEPKPGRIALQDVKSISRKFFSFILNNNKEQKFSRTQNNKVDDAFCQAVLAMSRANVLGKV